MFKSDVLFSGYYGQKNTGDDAFVEVSSWGVKKYWGKKSLRYLANKSNLPEVKEHIEGYPFSIPKTYGLQRHLLLRNADMLVSAGGSTFHDITPGSIKELTLNYRKRLKIGAIGVSLGPFLSVANERKIVEYLKNMDFLSLRDKSSYDFAKSLNLEYEPVDAFDLAALLPDIYSSESIASSQNSLAEHNESKKTLKNNLVMEASSPLIGHYSDRQVANNGEQKRIGVSVCNYESYLKGADIKNERRRNTFVFQLLERLSRNKDFRFRFFIFNGNERNGDTLLTKQIIEKLNLDTGRFEIVPYDKKTEWTWNLIQECDVMLSTRLHASIFACFANIPFFLVEYHKKCHDFLQDVGQEERYRLLDGEVDVENAADHITVAAYGNFILPKNLNEMKSKALLNFTSIAI